jgi:transposase-like protein
MKLRMAKASAERRVSQHCPFCKAVAVTQETTVKSTTTTKWWKCASCEKSWPDRRKASAA